jgi:hypothetical protein
MSWVPLYRSSIRVLVDGNALQQQRQLFDGNVQREQLSQLWSINFVTRRIAR